MFLSFSNSCVEFLSHGIFPKGLPMWTLRGSSPQVPSALLVSAASVINETDRKPSGPGPRAATQAAAILRWQSSLPHHQPAISPPQCVLSLFPHEPPVQGRSHIAEPGICFHPPQSLVSFPLRILSNEIAKCLAPGTC